QSRRLRIGCSRLWPAGLAAASGVWGPGGRARVSEMATGHGPFRGNFASTIADAAPDQKPGSPMITQSLDDRPATRRGGCEPRVQVAPAAHWGFSGLVLP